MKRFLTIIFLISFHSFIHGQTCIPSWSGSGYGITPDTLVGLPPAYEGNPYTATLQFRVQPDTTIKIGIIKSKVKINYIRIDSSKGLEAIPALVPFTGVCNPSSNTFEGDSTGCIFISGTAALGSAGTYILTVYVIANAYVNLLSTTLDRSYVIEAYKINVLKDTVSIGISENKFALLPNYPNPADKFVHINYFVPAFGKVNLKVYSLLGELVADKNLTSLPGFNEYALNVEGFRSGEYFYTLSYSENRLTGRLIIIR